MRLASLRLYCDRVLSLVCSNLTVFVGILGKIHIGAVCDRDLFAIRHGRECIVEPVLRVVINRGGTVPCHSYFRINSQSVPGDYVLHMDICDSTDCSDLNGISKPACFFVILRSFTDISLSRLRFIKYDITLHNIIEFDLSSTAVKLRAVCEPESDIGRRHQLAEIRIALIKPDGQLPIRCKAIRGIGLIGPAPIDNVDLERAGLLTQNRNALGHLISQIRVVPELILRALGKIGYEAVVGPLFDYVRPVRILCGSLNDNFCQEICEVRTRLCPGFRRIRHGDHKFHAVFHRDGQSLFTLKRRKTGKQPVAVCLLVYFDQIIVSEFHLAHIVNGEGLIIVLLIQVQLSCQNAEKHASLAGHGERETLVCEIDTVHDSIDREGLRVESDLTHFAPIVGIRIQDICLPGAVFEVHGRDFALARHFDGLVIRDAHPDSALRLDFLPLCPDCDVKKARFRHTLIRCRLSAFQIRIVFGSALFNLSDFEFSARRDLRVRVIGHGDRIAGSLIGEFACGERFFCGRLFFGCFCRPFGICF